MTTAPMNDPEAITDLLMSRIIDGEASPADHDRFEHMAAAEPTLWRQLALRQVDSVQLRDAVTDATRRAAAVDLPSRRVIPRMSWPLALSGWAAVLIALVSWGLVTMTEQRMIEPAAEPERASFRFTPEEHLSQYLSAPYVLGDMAPVVVDVKPVSDGRVAVHFVRRIEEIVFLDPFAELPVDADGQLTRDPKALRDREPAVPFRAPS
ncbi:MAG: hypothetical protein HKO59_03990 [Phycisphaerales bacterium]|nr:hypothetical protein [Phycisphaerae bacterium]NNF45101.1 hypothetical protein [Phycisphaerales bacterium]NNM25143.1 hypothetical protein [Phycisphaerales bacterium]